MLILKNSKSLEKYKVREVDGYPQNIIQKHLSLILGRFRITAWAQAKQKQKKNQKPQHPKKQTIIT